jgi:DNA primase
VSEQLVRDLQLGAVTTGRYGGRVIVPIIGQDGAWLWWVGRSWGPSERPYMYPRGARGALLFNHAALLRKTGDPVYVVEGVFDAMALWPEAVSVLGKPNELHLEALSAAQRPVAVVLDGDAWQEGQSVAARLRLRGCVAGSVRLAPREDPDEVSREWLEERARDACAQG